MTRSAWWIRGLVITGGVFAAFFIVLPAHAQTYGPNFLTTSTDIYSDSNSGAGSEPYLAIDGNLVTGWSSNVPNNDAYPHWLLYDTSSTPRIPARLRLYELTGSQHQKDFILEVSHDNQLFLTVATGTIPDEDSTWEVFEFTPTSTAYEYMRLYFSGPNYPANNYGQMAEWQLQECIDCGPPITTSTPTFAIPQDFTSVCYTQTGSTSSLVSCYEPWKVQLFWWLDFLFFATIAMIILMAFKFLKL